MQSYLSGFLYTHLTDFFHVSIFSLLYARDYIYRYAATPNIPLALLISDTRNVCAKRIERYEWKWKIKKKNKNERNKTDFWQRASLPSSSLAIALQLYAAVFALTFVTIVTDKIFVLISTETSAKIRKNKNKNIFKSFRLWSRTLSFLFHYQKKKGETQHT